MPELRKGVHTLRGNPLTLVGPEVRPGQAAPDFTMIDRDFHTVTLQDTPAKVRVFSVVPSLDTGVCDQQSRRFEAEAKQLGDRVAVYTISRDLPFAQKRWCGASEAETMEMLSDSRDHSFGPAYGNEIAEMGLLSRSIFVIDTQGIVRYVQYVPEFADLPDFDAALAAVRTLL
ncbi:MAG: thiol peroxidase [Thermaerobacter sp.]|nr:thiol peroxidase [Thermaerobacter sp.]